MPLSPALAAWLVERGHDAVHAAAIGLASESDVAIMARAKRGDEPSSRLTSIIRAC
jgi:hypothetical protein